MTERITLGEIAKIVDAKRNGGNENGRIDGKEISIFENTAKTDFKYTDAEIGDFLNSQKVATSPIDVEQKAAKAETKETDKAVADKVKELAKAGKDKEGLIEGLEKAFAEVYHSYEADGETHLVGDLKREANGKIIVQAQYKEYINKVAALYDAVEKAGTDKKALKALESDKFSKELVSSLKKVAENERVDAKAAEMAKNYDKKLGTGVYFEETYKAVKKEVKASDNYSKEDKKALKQLKERAKDKAYADASDILKDEETRPEGESKEAIRKEMRSMNKDDYWRDAVQKLKTDREVIANQNTVSHFVEEHPTLSEGEMKSGLKRRAAFGLVKTHGGADLRDKMESFKNPDGTYDTEAIADLVLNRAGFDAEVSRNDDDKIMAEIEGIRLDLESANGNKVEFSENEAKRIAKLVKVKIEHRDYAGAIARNLLPLAAAVVSGMTSGYVAKNGSLEITQELNQTLEFKSENDLSAIKQQLEEAGVQFEMDVTSNGTNILVKNHLFQQVIRNDRQLNAIMGGLIGSAVGGAAMLAGIILDTGKNEKSCISVSDYDIHDPKYTDINRYKDYVEKRYGKNPVKVAAMKALADKCYAEYGNNWHTEFQNIIREVGGFGSKTNPKECVGVKYVGPTTTPPTSEEQTKAYIADETETKTETKETPKLWGARKNHRNEDLVKMYDCLVEKYDPDFAAGKSQFAPNSVRIFKVMQAITDGNYDLDRLVQIAKDSKNMKEADFRAKYQNTAGFDVDKCLKVIHSPQIGADEINPDTKKADTYVLAPDQITQNGKVFCEKDESKITTSKYSGRRGNNGGYGPLNSSSTTTTSSTSYYGGKQGDASATTFDSNAARQTWINNLPKKTTVTTVGSKKEIEEKIKK